MLEPRQRQFPQDAFDLTPLTVTFFVVLTLLGLGLVAWNWWVHGRDRAYLTQHYLAGTAPAAAGPSSEPERIQPLFAHDTAGGTEFEPPPKHAPRRARADPRRER